MIATDQLDEITLTGMCDLLRHVHHDTWATVWRITRGIRVAVDKTWDQIMEQMEDKCS